MRTSVVWMLSLLAWALFAARVAIPAARNPNTNGFVAYYTESRVLLEDPRQLRLVTDDDWFQGRIDGFFGGHVLDVIHAQPPLMSLIMAPVAWLAPAAARAVWTGLGVVFWVAGIAAVLGALGVRATLGVWGRSVPPLVPSSALATLYTPLADNLRRGQSYALLFLLLCLALRHLLRPAWGRRAPAGVWLAVMLLLKGAGLWLWPLLAAARERRVLLAGAATVGAGVALSVCLFGVEPWRQYVQDYRWLAADAGSHFTAHQTVLSFFGHLLVREPTWNPAPVAHLPRVAAALTALSIAAALWATARAQRLAAPALEARALSAALIVSLMVPVAPRAEGYHYTLVFPALLIGLWWAWRAPARPGGWAALLGCAALLCVPQRIYGSAELARGWLALLAYPRLFGAFGLWAWLAVALRATRVTPPPAPGSKSFSTDLSIRPTPDRLFLGDSGR